MRGEGRKERLKTWTGSFNDLPGRVEAPQTGVGAAVSCSVATAAPPFPLAESPCSTQQTAR